MSNADTARDAADLFDFSAEEDAAALTELARVMALPLRERIAVAIGPVGPTEWIPSAGAPRQAVPAKR